MDTLKKEEFLEQEMKIISDITDPFGMQSKASPQQCEPELEDFVDEQWLGCELSGIYGHLTSPNLHLQAGSGSFKVTATRMQDRGPGPIVQARPWAVLQFPDWESD